MEESLIEEIKVLNRENDMFGTYDKAMAICNFLQLENNKKLLEKNNLIAIYGVWGSGKSCLMKTIESNLPKNEFETVWFDTWKYEKDDNLPYSLLKFMTKNKKINRLKENGKNILETGYSILKSMAKGIDINLGIINIKPGEAIDEVQKLDEERVKKIEDNKCLWEKINEFEEEYSKMTFNNKKLVVFLDDLDRCESENIINLISSIKLLLSVNKNIIFIIGIDKKAVTLALQNKYNNDFNKADEYLEKIFPINFIISNNINVENFEDSIVKIMKISHEDAKKIVDFLSSIAFSNSRHIKKVLRKYISIKEYLIRKDINLCNIYNIILVLYFIIIHIFHNDEYKYLLLENKEKIYNKILLINYDRNTGRKLENQFEQYNKKECNLNYNNGKKYEVFKLLVRFSSYKLTIKELKAAKYLEGGAFIEYYNWLGLFDDSICKNFIEFIMSNTNFLDTLFENGTYNDKKVYNMINEINNII